MRSIFPCERVKSLTCRKSNVLRKLFSIMPCHILVHFPAPLESTVKWHLVTILTKWISLKMRNEWWRMMKFRWKCWSLSLFTDAVASRRLNPVLPAVICFSKPLHLCLRIPVFTSTFLCYNNSLLFEIKLTSSSSLYVLILHYYIFLFYRILLWQAFMIFW
jgi:hypothetical protein